MTCALKLGLIISGRSSLIQCAVSFLGLRYHPLPVPLNSTQRLTWRDAQPRCVERERKREMSHLQAGEAQHRPLEGGSTQPCGGAGRGWWLEGVRAHRGASLFKRRSLSHYQQSGGKTGTVRISHEETAKAQFVHRSCCIRFPDYFDFEKLVFWVQSFLVDTAAGHAVATRRQEGWGGLIPRSD